MKFFLALISIVLVVVGTNLAVKGYELYESRITRTQDFFSRLVLDKHGSRKEDAIFRMIIGGVLLFSGVSLGISSLNSAKSTKQNTNSSKGYPQHSLFVGELPKHQHSLFAEKSPSQENERIDQKWEDLSSPKITDSDRIQMVDTELINYNKRALDLISEKLYFSADSIITKMSNYDNIDNIIISLRNDLDRSLKNAGIYDLYLELQTSLMEKDLPTAQELLGKIGGIFEFNKDFDLLQNSIKDRLDRSFEIVKDGNDMLEQHDLNSAITQYYKLIEILPEKYFLAQHVNFTKRLEKEQTSTHPRM